MGLEAVLPRAAAGSGSTRRAAAAAGAAAPPLTEVRPLSPLFRKRARKERKEGHGHRAERPARPPPPPSFTKEDLQGEDRRSFLGSGRVSPPVRVLLSGYPSKTLRNLCVQYKAGSAPCFARRRSRASAVFCAVYALCPCRCFLRAWWSARTC